MIDNYKKYKDVVKYEYSRYYHTTKERIESVVVKDSTSQIWKFQKLLRKTELFHNLYKNSKSIRKIFFGVAWTIERRRKNRLGFKLGIEITDGTFDSGLLIWHPSSIVVNGGSKVGKNCQIHGACCIGNNGKTEECPELGENVDIGFGACLIGGIKIKDNTKIGAGAIVVHSNRYKGGTIIGNKAKEKIKTKNRPYEQRPSYKDKIFKKQDNRIK